MKCPGQDSQYWQADAIYEVPCPNCGEMVEFFKDDSARSCSACQTRFANPRLDFGCAAYCPYASQCVGEQQGREQELTLKETLVQAVKQSVGRDQTLWQQLQQQAAAVESLARAEGASLFSALGLSYLHALEADRVAEVCKILEEKELDLTILRRLLAKKDLGYIEWQLIEDAEKIVSISSSIRAKDKKMVKNLVGLCHTRSARTYFDRFAKD